MRAIPALLMLAAVACAARAEAHVSADPGSAPAGSFTAVRFRVGHGCEDRFATTAVRLEIPAAVTTARPQPKPGWTLTLEKDGERVSAIIWRGELPPDEFDDFAVLMKLPAQEGPLYFPAVQTCGTAENQWTGVPDPDKPDERLAHPAPVLRLTPGAAPDGGHHH